MLRPSLLALLTGPAAAAGLSLEDAGGSGFGVVDMKRVYDYLARAHGLDRLEGQARRRVKNDLGREQKRLDDLNGRIRTAKDRLTADADEADRQRIADLEYELRLHREDMATLFDKRVTETENKARGANRALLRAVGDQVARAARAEGLAVVIDKGPWVRWIRPDLDLTDQVLRGLERERDTLKILEIP